MAICVVVLSGAAVYAECWERAQARLFFESALSKADITERISLQGTSYEVRAGRAYTEMGVPADSSVQEPVLALAYEKTLARRAPLFHLAGTNPNNLETVVDSLEDSMGKFSQQQDTPSKQERVSHLFPIDFLRSAATLERARHLFLESGSDADADAYSSAFENTLNAYQRALNDFSDYFEASVPATRQPFASGKIIVERNTVLQTVSLLLRQARETEHIAHNRSQCIRGAISRCNAADISVPEILLNTEESGASAAITHTQKMVAAQKKLDLINADDFRTIVVLEKSVCITPNWNVPPHFGFRAVAADFHNISYFRPALLGEMFLVENKTREDIEFFEAFSKRGMQYIPTQPLTYYKCLELDHEFGALAAIRDTYQFARVSLLSNYALGDNKQTLQTLERLLASSMVTERNTIQYLNAAQKLLGNTNVPQSAKDTLIELILEMRDRSAGTYNVALDAASMSEITLRLHAEGIPTELSGEYLFSARSGFPALYLANNPSATGHYPHLFKENTIPRSNQPYILLSDLLVQFPLNPALQKQVVHDIQTWKEIHFLKK